MEEQLTTLAVNHILQYTLRSFCIHENSQWVYAVFWRILPRNYPPPKWDTQAGLYERSRGNRRNWILVWEDGFCNFAASSSTAVENSPPSSSVRSGDGDYKKYQGLQPEVFFKMSHEIYNYGEGLIGKVAADNSHKWIYKEHNDEEINILSAWQNSADSHPRTWEAQFKSGIKTIALIAVREGVIQLGAVHKVIEDLSHVVLLRKKFSYIQSIPGVLLPHPSSSIPEPELEPDPFKNYGYGAPQEANWPYGNIAREYYEHYYNKVPMKITPSMSSLEALLSKLPSVHIPVMTLSSPPTSAAYCGGAQLPKYISPVEPVRVEEVDQEDKGSYQEYKHFGYVHNLDLNDNIMYNNHEPF